MGRLSDGKSSGDIEGGQMKPISSFSSGNEGQTRTTKMVDNSFSATSKLAKMLPTGVVFTFQMLSNLLSNNGNCGKEHRVLTGILMVTLGIVCFIFSLTDTYEDKSTGKVQYGIATRTGFASLTCDKKNPLNESSYKLNHKDWIHATLAVVVFAVMALSDKNIFTCLYPSAQSNINKLVQALPIIVSFLTSTLFTMIPSTSQGISHPVKTSLIQS